MIDKKSIISLIDKQLNNTAVFLVDVEVRNTGKIIVLIDSDKGVQIEDCALVTKLIEEQLGEESGNYEIMVSSPGADRAFSVLRQYLKNIDKEIEVLTEENKKIIGTLLAANEKGFEMIEKATKKNKQQPEKLTFHYSQIKETKRIVSLK